MTLVRYVIVLILMTLGTAALFAQQPHLEVSALDSLAIPYTYDYVYQLPNGDIQFYKLNYGASSIQFYGFQFLAQTNEITAQMDLGTVSGLGGLTTYGYYSVERFGKIYLVHDLTDELAVFILGQNSLTSRIVNEFTFDQYFDFRRFTDIVAEDAMAIALPDSLIYYNLIIGSCQTLLQGASYQCIFDVPIVISLPDSHFVYIKDSLSSSDQYPEVLEIFDSNGIHLGTNTSTDPDLLMNLVAKPTGAAPKKILGKWYIPVSTSDERTCSYECSFAEPDSLHIHFLGTLFSMYEVAVDYAPFGNDRILRLYMDNPFEIPTYYLYCNLSPIELYPTVAYTFNFGHYCPVLSTVSTDITTMSVRLPDSIAIMVLWTYDYPIVHEFYFPARTVVPTKCKTFVDGNNLRLLDNQIIYSYHVGTSSANADDVSEYTAHDLQVFPNPVRSGQQLSISSPTKQPMVVDVYNIRGQKVRTLNIDTSGQINWDLHSYDGSMLSAGIYIIKPNNANRAKPTKFLILK